jgi:hypothetical protein
MKIITKEQLKTVEELIDTHYIVYKRLSDSSTEINGVRATTMESLKINLQMLIPLYQHLHSLLRLTHNFEIQDIDFNALK